MRSHQHSRPSKFNWCAQWAFEARCALTAIIRLVVLCCLIAVATAQAAGAERRVALVIGNASYAALAPLKNPVNDATDIAAALEGLGFDVTLGRDVDQPRMTELVDAFARDARDADVSLFYYAGHGFQIASSNYLVPTDAVLRGRDDVARRTIQLNEMMRRLEGSRGIHLVFLDACRNNPLQPMMDGAADALRDGLARIGDAAGFLFAFATQPDNVAYDGVGRNSFFTQAVLGHIATPGQDVASMMIAVRRDVLAATGGKQVPWENSSLTRQFRFDTRPATASAETMLWQVAAKEDDPALMRIYLDRYPDGAHASDARQFLDRVEVALGPTDEDTTTRTVPERSEASVSEEHIWDLARRIRTRSMVQAYLDRFPDGRYAQEARLLLQALPAADDPAHICQRLATHPHDATANVAGVPLPLVQRNAGAAVAACRKAVEAHPDMPHYVALLARATIAAGNQDEAIRLYREAADGGDLRAMHSLGLIHEAGHGMPKDVAAAVRYYEQAANGGLADGAIDLAVALITGVGVERDVGRAVELLTRASDAGSEVATHNLGVLADNGLIETGPSAFNYFRKAAELGLAQAYLASAKLLDEGRGVARDPQAAADMLLQGVASDSGEALNELASNADQWSDDTIRAVQTELKRSGDYDGDIDGLSGPMFVAALERWRNGGFLDDLLERESL